MQSFMRLSESAAPGWRVLFRVPRRRQNRRRLLLYLHRTRQPVTTLHYSEALAIFKTAEVRWRYRAEGAG